MSMTDAIENAEAKRGRGRPKGSKNKQPEGRKDHSGQQAVINNTAFTDAIPGGIASYNAHIAAAKAFNKYVANVAKKSGYLAAQVRKVIIDATEKERFIEGRRKAEMLHNAYEARANAIQLDLLPGPGDDDEDEGDDAQRMEGEGAAPLSTH